MFAIFDFMLPGVLLEQTQALMFPVRWHVVLNHLWLLQTIIAMAWCISHKRWVPMKGGSYTPWASNQFRFLLLLHGLWFALELYTTSMWTKFTPMAMHHFLALFIFTTIFREANSLSIVTLTPFLAHTLYWALGAIHDPLLYIYNALLWVAGIVGLHNILMISDPADRPISLVLPLEVMSVVWINYFTYCHSYSGFLCWRPAAARARALRTAMTGGTVESDEWSVVRSWEWAHDKIAPRTDNVAFLMTSMVGPLYDWWVERCQRESGETFGGLDGEVYGASGVSVKMVGDLEEGGAGEDRWGKMVEDDWSTVEVVKMRRDGVGEDGLE
ncbi:hypothetical protein BC829DRAFT_428930 [Chytridium lagenaria]|nr:hypothetical protein BC829DRAFT_428930 [Chytridium lagenaria]